MSLIYSIPFLQSFILSLILTWVLLKASVKFKVFFKCNAPQIYKDNIFRLGGMAIILSFASVIILDKNLVLTGHLFGFLFGAGLVLVIGTIDDFFNIKPRYQLFAQFFIALSVVLSGIRVDYLANPLGGVIRLDGDMVFGFPLAGSVFIIFWIIILINVLNWSDGIDGLAGGVGAIGASALFFLSIAPLVNQPPLGIISIIFLGSLLGFLIFNFYPAKIFMGTSGAMFTGFALGVISIFSGAKLATLALVLSVPILDAAWVIIHRIQSGKSIFKGDYSHLHYRLRDLGFSVRQIVIFYYAISAVFGFVALNAGGFGKAITFGIFAVIMIVVLTAISSLPQRKSV